MSKKKVKVGFSKSIKAVCFDFGGVIVPDFHLPVISEIAELLKISSQKAETLFDELWVKWAVGQGTENDFWQNFLKESPIKTNAKKLSFCYRENLIPDLRVLNLLKILAKKVKLISVSNTTREWFGYLVEKYRLNDWFDKFANSPEAGARKPSPEFMANLKKNLALMGSEPQECLFVDDSQKAISVAQAEGYQVFLFKDAEGLEKKLREVNLIS